MLVEIFNKSDNYLPAYETKNCSGMDLRAFLENNESIRIMPGEWKLIPTGIHISIPVGGEAQIRSRSGLALKFGVTVLNSPGTIDSDYRGELKVILINHSLDDFVVRSGDRIAQIVFCEVERIEWKQVLSLDDTERGSGGFGHTGVK